MGVLEVVSFTIDGVVEDCAVGVGKGDVDTSGVRVVVGFWNSESVRKSINHVKYRHEASGKKTCCAAIRRGLEHTKETVEVLTDCEAVTVFWTVTGSGLDKKLCTKDVKRSVNGERCDSEVNVGTETREPGKGNVAVVEREGTRVEDKELEKAPPED